MARLKTGRPGVAGPDPRSRAYLKRNHGTQRRARSDLEELLDHLTLVTAEVLNTATILNIA